MNPLKTRAAGAALILAAALGLAACGGSPADSDASANETSQATDAAQADTQASAAGEVTIEDNRGKVTVKTPPKAVVATDNRTFETLSDWGIKLVAAPIDLMPEKQPIHQGLLDR